MRRRAVRLRSDHDPRRPPMTALKLHPLFVAAVVLASIVLFLAFAAIDAPAALKPCYPNCPW
jgi:hypothetical protein